ncbi:hypothetical protein [Ruegeria pomeroyi]|nr:hypothetical protein [Ruegeria pomeroyi]
MKAFLSAVVLMAVITVAAPQVLSRAGFSAAERGTGADVRLD